MGSKIGIRIISICLALFFLGMWVPSLTKASISTDSGLSFDEVLIDSEKTMDLVIQNQNADVQLRLYFRLDSGDTCGFSFDESLQGVTLDPGQTARVGVTYTPSSLDSCSGKLIVLYIGGGLYGNMEVPLEGMGVEELAPSTVMIDGQDTAVENGLYREKPISEWLEGCSERAKNHGQYVRCMALMTRKMRKAKVLEKEDRRAIMKAAAHANIPKKETSLEGLVYNDKPVIEWIEECKESAENNRQYVRCVYQLMKEMKKEGVIKTRKEKHQIRRYAARLRFHGGRR